MLKFLIVQCCDIIESHIFLLMLLSLHGIYYPHGLMLSIAMVMGYKHSYCEPIMLIGHNIATNSAFNDC